MKFGLYEPLYPYPNMDTAVFYWIDQHLQSPMLDAFMGFMTNKKNFVWPGIIVGAFLVLTGKARGIAFLVVAGIMVAVNDAFSHYILKSVFARPRPCHVVDILQHIQHCSNSYSFPSNHAGNSFTIAALSTLCYRNSILLVGTLASLICISRVYLGQHYLSDVIAGAACGILMGYIGFRLYQWILKALPDRVLSLSWTPPNQNS